MTEACLWCDDPIGDGEDVHRMPHIGKDGPTIRPIHYECFTRMVVGGLNHLTGKCSCCGGTEPPDPPELTKRQAAAAAAKVAIRVGILTSTAEP